MLKLFRPSHILEVSPQKQAEDCLAAAIKMEQMGGTKEQVDCFLNSAVLYEQEAYRLSQEKR